MEGYGKKAGQGLDKAADKTQRGVDKAAYKTGQGLDTAAQKTGQGFDTAADRAGEGLDKAGQKAVEFADPDTLMLSKARLQQQSDVYGQILDVLLQGGIGPETARAVAGKLLGLCGNGNGDSEGEPIEVAPNVQHASAMPYSRVRQAAHLNAQAGRYVPYRELVDNLNAVPRTRGATGKSFRTM